jgi:hypothetical protein
MISPGVQVIADYDEPIFYSDNYYWRTDGGVWYRSSNYQRGWVRYEAAPAAVISIQQPSAYIHYHGEAHANPRREQREPAPPPPEVRDHREAMPPPPPPPAPPVVRDHRDNAPEPRREEPRDQRKDDRKGDHKDDKGDHKDKKDHRGH